MHHFTAYKACSCGQDSGVGLWRGWRRLGVRTESKLNSALPPTANHFSCWGLLKTPTNHLLPSQGPRACFAQAQFDFSAQDPSQLSFHRGDIIEVLERLDPHWWRGRFCGRVGFFPRSYVQPVQL